MVIDRGNGFLRVQVKSTARLHHCKRYRKAPPTIYAFSTSRRSGKAYRKSDLDFYALYVIPRNLWYIIPHRTVGSVIHLHVYPAEPSHRFERYREAWHLLRKDDQDGFDSITIHACGGRPKEEANENKACPRLDSHAPPHLALNRST